MVVSVVMAAVFSIRHVWFVRVRLMRVRFVRVRAWVMAVAMVSAHSIIQFALINRSIFAFILFVSQTIQHIKGRKAILGDLISCA